MYAQFSGSSFTCSFDGLLVFKLLNKKSNRDVIEKLTKMDIHDWILSEVDGS